MNIFVTDRDPKIAAQNLCDIHVNKMLLESVQMLCTYLNELGLETPYKTTHKNHPCSLWIKYSCQNLSWIISHINHLGLEYTYRYSKIHKCTKVFYKLIIDYFDNEIVENAVDTSEFVQAMPDEFKQEDAVKAYREYYIYKQKTFKRKMKWTNREKPSWFIELENK